MLAWMMSFLRTPVKKEQLGGFDVELVRRNYWMVTTVLPLIAVFEAYNIINVLFLHSAGLSTANNRAYFSLYFLLLLATLITIAIGVRFRKRVEGHGNFLLNASFLYGLVISLFGVGITVLDARHGFDISVYSIIIISIAIFIYIRPWQALLLFFANHFILLSFVIPHTVMWNVNSGEYINLTIICIISLGMSLSRYHSKAADYNNQCVIHSQSAQIQQMNEKLRRMALTDMLSGLYNRRFLEEELSLKWQDMLRAAPAAIIMLDIDDFKQYNDDYGHPAGDACIQAIARTMERCTCPGKDYLVRYGGEEFTAVLFHADEDEARSAAQAICGNVEQMELGEGRRVTVSEGVCVCPAGAGCSLRACLKQADQALYQAKRDGKNRVVMHQP